MVENSNCGNMQKPQRPRCSGNRQRHFCFEDMATTSSNQQRKEPCPEQSNSVPDDNTEFHCQCCCKRQSQQSRQPQPQSQPPCAQSSSPQMGQASRAPQMGQATRASQMGHASQMGQIALTSQMRNVPRALQMGSMSLASHMDHVSRASQMTHAARASQMGQGTRCSQMGQRTRPSLLGEESMKTFMEQSPLMSLMAQTPTQPCMGQGSPRGQMSPMGQMSPVEQMSLIEQSSPMRQAPEMGDTSCGSITRDTSPTGLMSIMGITSPTALPEVTSPAALSPQMSPTGMVSPRGMMSPPTGMMSPTRGIMPPTGMMSPPTGIMSPPRGMMSPPTGMMSPTRPTSSSRQPSPSPLSCSCGRASQQSQPVDKQAARENENKCRIRKLQMENLVKDQYCPGAIQSTVDLEENFNEVSFRLVFGCDQLPQCAPAVEPITLLEAFCLRIELERCLLKSQVLAQGAMNPAHQRRSSYSGEQEMAQIDDFFRAKYATDLNIAIAALLKAERIDEAINPPENSPTIDAQINKSYAALPELAIKIMAYTGSTKPMSKYD